MPSSMGLFLLCEKLCVLLCWNNNFESVTLDLCPVFFAIAFAEEQASLFWCPGSKPYVFYSSPWKQGLGVTTPTERVTFLAFFVLLGPDRLLHAGVGWEGRPWLLYYAYFTFSQVFLMTLFDMHMVHSFLFRPAQPIQSLMEMAMMIMVTVCLAILPICTYSNAMKYLQLCSLSIGRIESVPKLHLKEYVNIRLFTNFMCITFFW